MSTIGFIGLGTMGAPMAENLINAGHQVIFFSRRDEVARHFQQLGARRSPSPAEVARSAEYVITIVTADDEVREVALGPDGLIHGTGGSDGNGKMLIEMSTISPATIRDVAKHLSAAGMSVLDAPVSGGPWGARAATLSIMVGGLAEDFQRAQHLLKALGDKIFHVGPLGAGQTVKLVNQLIGAGIMVLIGEGFALAKAAGINLEKLADVIAVSSGNSTIFEARGKKFVLSDHYEPGFKTALMLKDVSLAVNMAEALGVPLPMGAETLQQYLVAMNRGFGNDDFASVAKVCAQAAGVKLTE